MNKYHKAILGLVLTTALILMNTSTTMAQGFAQTLVAGFVYDSNMLPVTTGSVTINCGTGSQTVSIGSDGSYNAFFSQSECRAGDSVSATASTSEGNGSNSTVVSNTSVNGPVVDLDIALLDVNVNVPELGVIGGMMSLIGAAGSYLYLRPKMV